MTDFLDYLQPSVLLTSDGSSTLRHSVLDELYHSRHGAWTESCHIFIRYGLTPLAEQNRNNISVFEMGFGSGLNAALTREMADKLQVAVQYTGFELYPVEPEIVADMIMPAQAPAERDRWLELHQMPWGEPVRASDWFTLIKHKASFPGEVPPDIGKFDLVYYDAFAPAAQPELWNSVALEKCFELLNEGGLWLSYCAKGQVRRTLKNVGFEVESLPGPPGKREITRAVKRI